jgi:hypothetical protein
MDQVNYSFIVNGYVLIKSEKDIKLEEIYELRN